MKIQIKKEEEKKVFKPVTIEITMESIE